MDEQRFRRVFDQIKPSLEQKEAMLDRLLEPERKGRPMKKLRKLTVAAVAAALMLVTCAAAVVTGLDQRLLDYFGVGPKQAELLTPGALPVDITAEDNGAALHVTQVLRDRYSILILADFTAPEGTVLEEKSGIGFDRTNVRLLHGKEEQENSGESYLIQMESLEDEDPLDNHLTLLVEVTRPERELTEQDEVTACQLQFKDLRTIDISSGEHMERVVLYSGSWACDVPLPEQDMGLVFRPDAKPQLLHRAEISVQQVYLSPMTAQIKFERMEGDERAYRRWMETLIFADMTLTSQDGEEVELKKGSNSGDEREMSLVCRLSDVVDPARFQDGTLTLTLSEETVTIPLGNLAPAE